MANVSVSTLNRTNKNSDPRIKLLSYLMEQISVFADLREDIIEHNVKLWKNSPDSERRILFKRSAFLLTHFGGICSELVFQPSFREEFYKFVVNERKMDMISREDEAEARRQMHIPNFVPDDAYILYGKHVFPSEIYESMYNAAKQSFKPMLDSGDYAAYKRAAENISTESRRDMGIAFSSFAYMMRGVAKNDRYIADLASLMHKLYYDKG